MRVFALLFVPEEQIFDVEILTERRASDVSS